MTLIVAIVGVVLIGALYVLLPVFLRTRRRLQGPRVVRCPESLEGVVVELDAARGARGALFGRSALHIQQCARWQDWPAHRDCDQDCLKGVGVEAAENHAMLTSRDSHS